MKKQKNKTIWQRIKIIFPSLEIAFGVLIGVGSFIIIVSGIIIMLGIAGVIM